MAGPRRFPRGVRAVGRPGPPLPCPRVPITGSPTPIPKRGLTPSNDPLPETPSRRGGPTRCPELHGRRVRRGEPLRRAGTRFAHREDSHGGVLRRPAIGQGAEPVPVTPTLADRP